MSGPIQDGIKLAREAGDDAHADAMEAMKAQLIIALMKRLADKDGRVEIPVAEVDNTGGDILSFRYDPRARAFIFQLGRKQ